MKRLTTCCCAAIACGLLATAHATEAPTPAPGRGVIAAFSAHSQAVPALAEFERQPIEWLDGKTGRQYLHGAASTTVRWTLKRGAHIGLHQHPNEQVTWIAEGRVEVFSQGRRYTVGKGEVLIIPANVPHEFVALEDTIDIDFFSPGRQDWVEEGARKAGMASPYPGASGRK